jgi:glycosyltransferase involved in cell wall biosynthesis
MRTDVARHVGGQGSGKVRRYADYLRQAGVDVTVWSSDRDPPGRYDVGHVLNLDWPVEVARQVAAARRRCDRVVLSPIHHRESWMAVLNRRARGGLSGKLGRRVSVERFEAMRGAALALRAPRQLPEAARQLVLGVRSRQRQVLDSVDLCLPLARGEEDSLAEDFGFRGPARHVPNAAEHVDEPPPPGLPSEFLLCVGRVEARKNQLDLLEAAELLDLPVVLAGPPNARHRALVGAVAERERSSSAVTWLRTLPRRQVLALYGAAEAHVLPSWCEVVAQVDLEAVAAGTRLVTTARGHMDEYLGDDALYWDPPSGPERLAEAIARVLERPRPAPRPDRFPMEDVGGRLLRAYEDVLSS